MGFTTESGNELPLSNSMSKMGLSGDRLDS